MTIIGIMPLVYGITKAQNKMCGIFKARFMHDIPYELPYNPFGRDLHKDVMIKGGDSQKLTVQKLVHVATLCTDLQTLVLFPVW